eukprot:570417-Rhodomonas_salina.1
MHLGFENVNAPFVSAPHARLILCGTSYPRYSRGFVQYKHLVIAASLHDGCCSTELFRFRNETFPPYSEDGFQYHSEICAQQCDWYLVSSYGTCCSGTNNCFAKSGFTSHTARTVFSTIRKSAHSSVTGTWFLHTALQIRHALQWYKTTVG